MWSMGKWEEQVPMLRHLKEGLFSRVGKVGTRACSRGAHVCRGKERRLEQSRVE